MFRFEKGAKILVKKYDWDNDNTIEVEILDKAPNRIKALILSGGWFIVGGVHWLSSREWFSVGRAGSRPGETKGE